MDIPLSDVNNYHAGVDEKPNSRFHWEVSVFKETPSKVVLICGKGDASDVPARLRNVPPLQSLKSEALSIRLFYKISAPEGEHPYQCLVTLLWDTQSNTIPSAATSIVTSLGGTDPVPITPIPCRHIASKNGDDWDYAILAICTSTQEGR